MKLFTPGKIGPVELRNRTIRSAAFEGMGKDNNPTAALRDYHLSVARGGVGMTTLAYAGICRSALSFDTQLWLRPEIVAPLREITDGIHAAGAKASIQIGHCGNMTHRSTAGGTPVGASGGFNLYSPTLVRALRKDEIANWRACSATLCGQHVTPVSTAWKCTPATVTLSRSSSPLTPTGGAMSSEDLSSDAWTS